jgi:uncharacterized BrkB/YihY/UPF0761 family membrane protein
MLRGLWLKFDRDWGWNLARILAYACLQMLFAVLGLQLIVLALFLRLSGERLEQNTVNQLTRLLPDHITSAAVSSFERALQHAPWWLLLTALPLALWEGSRFFVVLESALCVIFRRQQRTFLRQNRFAFAMLLAFAVLVPVIVLSAAAAAPRIVLFTGHGYALAGFGGFGGPLLPYLAVGAGVAANFVMLLVAYMFITPGRVAFRASWPGALLAALLVELYVLIFPIYVRGVLHPDHFGTVAGFVLVILVFFFAYALFIVIGAEVAAWQEGYRAAACDIPTTLALAAPPHQRRDLLAGTQHALYPGFGDVSSVPPPSTPPTLPTLPASGPDAPPLPSTCPVTHELV